MRIFQSTQPSQAVTQQTPLLISPTKISIHTALAGCDIRLAEAMAQNWGFQSTQPSQAVTYWTGRNWHPVPYFNPHSPRRL